MPNPIRAIVHSDRELRRYSGRRIVLAVPDGKKWIKVYPTHDLTRHPIRLSRRQWQSIVVEEL